MNDTVRQIIATVVAGVVGNVVNAVAASILVNPDLIHFALVPGRYLVAILVAALIPLFMALVGGTPALVLSFVGLTVVPSLLAKLVFGSAAPWILVLVLNAIYAIAAMVTYKAIVRN
jgi:hypothetical protein